MLYLRSCDRFASNQGRFFKSEYKKLTNKMGFLMLLRLSLHHTVLVLFLLVITTVQAASADRSLDTLKPDNPRTSLQQFTSKAHVTGFEVGEMYIAALDHGVNIKFVDANPVAPVSSQSPSATTSLQQLQTVNYDNLWDGIDLEYDRGNGIVRSTYTLAPGAAPQDIALLYNTSFEIQQNGALHLNFETGVLTESAPVAWQDIDGERMPVKVVIIETTKKQLGFEVGEYDINQPLIIDPTLEWLTFIGAADSNDSSNAIAIDAENNIIIAGASSTNWGVPITTASESGGVLVAKFDSSGTYLWHTFLVENSRSSATGVAVNSSGDIWVTGLSFYTWGAPINDHTRVTLNAGFNSDIFVAKLNSIGELQWNTFHGSSKQDDGNGIVVDNAGNSYVVGSSWGSWAGNPTREPYSVGSNTVGINNNIIVFSLDTDGALGWNAFYGYDRAEGFAIARSGDFNLYITGTSWGVWGFGDFPVENRHLGGSVGNVAKISTAGYRRWYTVLGENYNGSSIAADSLDNVYIGGDTGNPIAGEPIRPYTGAGDIFVTKLNSQGYKQWHTYIGGSTSREEASAIVVSESSIYVAGYGGGGWGSPLNAHNTNGTTADVLVAEFNHSGKFRHHTFLGSNSNDFATAAAVDTNNELVITGNSEAAWPETAINDYTGGTEVSEIFVRKIAFPLLAEIQVLGNNTLISNGDLEPGVGDDTDFGAIAEAGEFTIERSYTIESFGTGALLLSGDPIVEISGAHASDFSVTSLPSSPIPTSSDTEFSVTFNPTAVGLRTATISIENNVSDENPYVFSVQGTGNPPLPEIEVRGGNSSAVIPNGRTQAGIAYGTQFESLYSEIDGSFTHTFTINNIGTADLTLSGVPAVAISGPDAADFTVTTPPDTPISGDGTTTFDIKYELTTPVPSIEARKATVSIENNDPDEAPFTFSILGLALTSASLSGTLSGLAPGNTIVIQNYWSRFPSATSVLNLSANGAFVFDHRIPHNFAYEVTITSLPDNPEQVCDVVNGTRTVVNVTEITDLEINCVPVGYTVGGTATGLEGEGLILQINNGDDLAVNANGEFTFLVGLEDAAVYDVSILTPPTEPEQDYTLSNNRGTIDLANVTNVGLDCVTPDLIHGGCAGSLEEPGCGLDEP